MHNKYFDTFLNGMCLREFAKLVLVRKGGLLTQLLHSSNGDTPHSTFDPSSLKNTS